MEPGLSSPGTSPRRGRPALWRGRYGLLRARKQQSEQLGAAFAVDDPVDEVGSEATLERDHRFLRVSHVITKALKGEQEAGVGPVRIDEVARRARKRQPALGERVP